MLVLRQAVTLVNQKLFGFREDAFVTHNFSQFIDEGVVRFDLLLAGCHYRSVAANNAMIHYATACQNPER
jgi:hypothetical protein